MQIWHVIAAIEIVINKHLPIAVNDPLAASGKVKSQPFSKAGENGNRSRALVTSRYFVVVRFELEAEEVFEFSAHEKSSAQILVAVDGAGVLHAPDSDPVQFGKGDAVVVPAAIQQFTIQPQPRMELLKSSVPGGPVREPEIISD